MDRMKILVTGASGFIGREFVKQAKAAGHDLVCPGREWTEKQFLLGRLVPKLKSFDAVVHLAAAGVPRDRRQWDVCMAVNFHALRYLLEIISVSGATPFVFVARSQRESDLADDTDLWRDAYYVTKAIGGQFAQVWGSRYAGRSRMPELAPCYGVGEVQAVAARILQDITA